MKFLAVTSSVAAAAGLLGFFSQPGCYAPGDPGHSRLESSSARELVSRVQSTFLAAAPSEDGRTLRSLPLLGEPLARGFDHAPGLVSPHFAHDLLQKTRRKVTLELPQTATGAFRLADVASAMALEVSMHGASNARGEAVDGFMVYRDALDTGHVIHRPQPDGTEDWVLLEHAPAVPELRYAVRLASGVAGLRLVADTLEFLAADGVPRLRMAPPFIVGSDGARQWASVQLQGCAADSSPVPPWGRPVTAPGADACTVIVRWGAAAGQAEPRYPALLDPAWVSTGNMSVKRYFHQATLLGDGRVLVTGGRADNTTVHAKAELYSPSSGTFTSTSNMSGARANHAACVLNDGRVMVMGGVSPTTLATAEAFDPNNASWTSLSPMGSPRSSHTCTPLASGEVLVAGGEAGVPLASAELYVVSSDGWLTTGSMAQPRVRHTATRLDNGKVLAVGGESPTFLNTAELYDRTHETWTATPPMATARASHTATAIENGKVLVAGGDGSPVVKAAESYDSNSNAWESVPDLAVERRYHTASKLLNGRVIIAGGYFGSYLASSEMFDPSNPGWSSGGDMKVGRIRHTSTTLNTGKVLVTGGLGTSGGLNTAELFELQKNGVACSSPSECTTGWCVDGVCCDAQCTGGCMACTAALKNQGADGVCGAIANGVDPQDECESLGTGTCQTTGTCDGNGACGTQAGMQCEAAQCIDEVTQQNPWTCDALGNCNDNGSGGCQPFLCQGSGCLKSCATAADCIENAACVGGKCVAPGGNGTPCGGNIDCDSGFCVESVCCDAACNSTCQSCREMFKDQGPDGACGAAKVGLACGETKCINGQQVGPQCTQQSTCEDATIPCAPYLCADATNCAVQCTTDAQCKSGNYCKAGKCVAKGNLGSLCKENKECLSTYCVDWVCCDSACGSNVSTDCHGCSMAVGSSADGKCEVLNDTECGVAGLCSAGVCIEGAVKDAAAEAAPDAAQDALTEAGEAAAPDAAADVVTADGPMGPDGAIQPDGSGVDAEPDGAAGGTAAPAAEDSGGCGCRTAPSSTPASLWLGLLGAAVVVVRRRRRR